MTSEPSAGSSAEVTPGDGPSRHSRRLWTAVRSRVDGRLTDIDREVGRLGPYLVASILVAFIVVAPIRLIHSATVTDSSAVLGWLGIVPSIALAGACIALLVWAYVQTHLQPDRSRPYIVALLSSVVALAVCVEAFAGVTTLLWQRDLVAATDGLEPALWTTEHFYLWHVVDSVPLLDAAQTVGWPRPVVFVNQVSGIMLVLLKLLVIVPLLQIAIAAYRLIEGRRLSLVSRPPRRSVARSVLFLSPAEPEVGAWRAFVGLLPVTVLSWAAFGLVLDRRGFVARWLRNDVADGIDAFGWQLSLTWLPTAVEWAIVAGLAVIGLALITAFLVPVLRVDSFRGLVGVVLAYACSVALLLVVAAGTTLVLDHAGLVTPEPQPPPGGEATAALAWYAWHVADAIPVLDIPRSMNWSISVEFVGHWTGAILLYSKALFFALLIVPAARAARTYLRRTRPRPAPIAQLDAHARFSETLSKLQAELDEVEGDLADAQGAYVKDVARSRRLAGAHRTVAELDASLDQVRSLFGEEAVARAAAEAVSLAEERLATVEDIETWVTLREPRADEHAQLREARAAALSGADAYAMAAATALREAAGRDPGTNRPSDR